MVKIELGQSQQFWIKITDVHRILAADEFIY